jgi:hypothetical protein
MTDEQIKSSLKDKINQSYNEYVRKVERYVNALKALGENVSIGSPLTTPTGTVKGGLSVGFTMKQKIIQVLKDAGKPLTSREIMDSINNKFPDRTYDFNAFSGNFSQTWRKAGLQKYERPDKPIEFRVVYGLSNWFAGTNLLKQKYKDLL